MKKIVRIGAGVVTVIVVLLVGLFVYGQFFAPKGPTLTNTMVAKQLEKIQDLTTAKETDYGFEKYDEGSIKFVNKKSFTMFYAFEARAGIDLSKADISVNKTNKTIDIKLPAPTIQSVSVDPDSLEFFDQESSMFSSASVDDAKTALQDAKNAAEKKLNKGELLKVANKQAKDVIERMYSPVAETDGYTVNVITTEPES
ncbi:DUF4230 domain-containing protein [Bifidobacterium sp. LC6]|uniref:DUF4230 domain-containing protein n=1 Tax=Bifidobacterium colobi TaxID=2809026 RepID=A0ABS5UVD7_9BIFI|nr:DUF4230 domain-containing protein [Bifidobacterium colobi]MBT1174631.1 DUF4230 domain-containing protein [Bifidobacterium colobi]